MTWSKRPWLFAVLAVIVIGAAYYGWQKLTGSDLPVGIASGNGRIEAVEIDISTKTPGRIREILVDEGDLVTAGQVLARMDTDQLEAQRRQAEAQLRRAEISIDTARSLVTQREAERTAAEAVVAQREAELDSADRKLARSEQLIKTNATSQQTLDDDRAAAQGARAAISAAKAQLAASEAAIGAAKAQVIDAEAAVDAAKAQIESITTDINDAVLRSPRDGRVQYRVAQPGEVLSAGGRVLNLVDLSEVYMTFFLPTAQAGRVAIGTDVRLVLDAAPQYVIPATATFVSDVAQFTPRSVETEEERQKLMFRVKARIPKELLKKYIQYVKTGLPGMAYIRLDPSAEWPARLSGTLVQ
ncbi:MULTISPECIES: HlyD family efflux transporter periplasmic adaptor subunit [unclassified Chelatococcus]|uniref:HlyD family secretion protein n=2 Tax=Chelatococcus TaxID=28209 RepID=UPI001BD01284|nr:MULTISPECIES: HlyD family efflux transporter periplasmic adaptor subunit [unclassified Chelatococcus]CAH1649973.1 putative membrane fusion protein YhiI [Hyphomicrobiales bacterium]MBS7743370.1 HlyD family efflux transporter periplasmic adaptor subunit [Chelatococcus sp. HY11]MBX3541512.1 HlyD family efflux transporter periplasmic adaptor subunit [Chelatococcus sp.]MCO5074595.1 HlyD family efflux transporter periplasmic adaptor subunit [Chelatococcus sp.]CAH1692324.1 putative membrane fusion